MQKKSFIKDLAMPRQDGRRPLQSRRAHLPLQIRSVSESGRRRFYFKELQKGRRGLDGRIQGIYF